MSIGTIFLAVAVFFFFLAGVGSTLIPNPTTWGLCALTLGIMLSGVKVWKAT